MSFDATVTGIKENILRIQTTEDRPIAKNEVAYVHVGDRDLKAEVLRVFGNEADLQVYEPTRGARVGDGVTLSGQMLAATLGPGMLGQIYDGLQNPLDVLAAEYGFFLPRGIYPPPLNQERRWDFTPKAQVGDRVLPGQVLGSVPENHLEHRIMVPPGLFDECEVVSIERGDFTVTETIAVLRKPDGSTVDVAMQQPWPVRRPMNERMLRKRYAERLFPNEPLITTQRIIDTFLPIARGGTACVPGPFGAGKTVLQSLISRFANVDIVIVVACGERAGEVVETITEFPTTKDPKTGGTLMDRTILICNTSSMPVAARESSVYTGVTLGEYYRMMGYDVLILADSTSRWAQAMRETSGRLEEIPGEEAFPAYLDSNIKAFYERAGVLSLPGGGTGSLTILGTVSPAGGNFEEPVTQSTLSTVKTFLGLSSARAYKRFYPAIDPLISWSRYLDQLAPWYTAHIGPTWVQDVRALHDLLHTGESIHQMMQVTGESGIPVADYVTYQKALFLDMVFLQQDAFDDVDISMPHKRQIETLKLVKQVIDTPFNYEDREDARAFFTKLTGLFRNLNYSTEGTANYAKFKGEIDTLVAAQPK